MIFLYSIAIGSIEHKQSITEKHDKGLRIVDPDHKDL